MQNLKLGLARGVVATMKTAGLPTMKIASDMTVRMLQHVRVGGHGTKKHLLTMLAYRIVLGMQRHLAVIEIDPAKDGRLHHRGRALQTAQGNGTRQEVIPEQIILKNCLP